MRAMGGEGSGRKRRKQGNGSEKEGGGTRAKTGREDRGGRGEGGGRRRQEGQSRNRDRKKKGGATEEESTNARGRSNSYFFKRFVLSNIITVMID